MIELEGRSADRVINLLGGLLGVSAVHTTNGKWDLVVELCAENLIDFDAVLYRIRLMPGIVYSETNLLLSTPRSIRAIIAQPKTVIIFRQRLWHIHLKLMK